MRASAVTLVLLSHCGDIFASWFGARSPAWLSVSGFFGVELFFVLSGFLIGRLLIAITLRRPTPRDWLVFMQRRWMRTLPLYYVWLAVLAVIWPPRFWEAGHRAVLWHDLPYFAGMMQNLAWPMLPWFGVSWSLAVEEWFYLLFSALLMAATARIGRRAGLWLCTAAFLVIPPILRWHMPDTADFSEVISKMVVLRLDAIAFGVVMAWLQIRGAMVFLWPRGALAAGLLIIGALWTGRLAHALGLGPNATRTFLFSAASVGFALCLPAADALNRLPRYTDAIVRTLSRLSYAIYLIHLSVLEMAGFYRVRWHLPPALAVVATLVAIGTLAAASWTWLESPILRRRPRQPA